MTTHKSRAHARLGGSTSERWLNCHGSVALCESLPEEEPSEAAKRGTYIHEAAEECVSKFLETKLTGVSKPPSKHFDEEAIDIATAYTTTIWEKVLQHSVTGKAYNVEEQVMLSKDLDQWGIIDFWCIYIDDRGKRILATVDLKTGYHEVEVKNNPQFLFYLCAMRQELLEKGKDIDGAISYVYQPKAEGEPLKKATYTKAQLEKWTAKFKKAGRDILNGSSKLKAGSWCFFCRAKGVCKEYGKTLENKSALSILKDTFIPATDIAQIPVPTRVSIALHAKELSDFIDAVKASVISDLLNGKRLPGAKLVEGAQGKRSWIEDEDKVAQTLQKAGINPYRQKLITITEASKGFKIPEELTVRGASSKSLVPESDPRVSIETARDLLK